jgi:cell division transport system permease protein
MKGGVRKFGTADRRLLPEGRLAGPMPWVIAIMMFLTVLAAAAGLGLNRKASSLNTDMGNRLTIQVLHPDPERREAEARALTAVLEGQQGVEAIRRIDAQALLEPWIGAGGLGGEIPIPVMIEADLARSDPALFASLRGAAASAAPSARVDENARWLEPLARLISALKWLTALLVLLMIGATAATVVLAARASLDTHRGTIEVLHFMGATDVQVARLFQRRIALDALFGGVVGLVAAIAILLVIGNRVAALGSDLLGSAGLPAASWLLLATLPAAGVLLAMLVARATILRALGRLL